VYLIAIGGWLVVVLSGLIVLAVARRRSSREKRLA
jgi:hypothetical protein